MLLDKQLQFEDTTAITVSRVGTNVLDLSVFREMGAGEPLAITAISNGLFASSGSTATLAMLAMGSTDNSSFTEYARSPAYTQAQLVARTVGAQPFVFPINWPTRSPGAAKPRYLRLDFVVASGPFTAGALIGAWLNLGRDEIEFYPRNYSVAGLAP